MIMMTMTRTWGKTRTMRKASCVTFLLSRYCTYIDTPNAFLKVYRLLYSIVMSRVASVLDPWGKNVLWHIHLPQEGSMSIIQ
jgi:hypothetical protein